MKVGDEMIFRVPELLLNQCHQDLALLHAPAEDASEKGQGVWLHRHEHVLALVHPKLFEAFVFGPTANGYLKTACVSAVD